MATAQPGMSPEMAAGFRQIMLDGVTRELETTKRVLSAIPDAKAQYRPDPDVQFLTGIADLKFTMANPDDKDKPKTVAELVNWYDKNFKSAAERVRALTPEQLATPIDFMGIFNFPAVAYLGFLNNHSIHHRGQLATYLRPMGAKCPAIYGGSFDEPFQGAPPKSSAA
jgi:hypothetical protein